MEAIEDGSHETERRETEELREVLCFLPLRFYVCRRGCRSDIHPFYTGQFYMLIRKDRRTEPCMM